MTMNDYQLQIERLVDGELPFAEEAKLLEACEEQPAGWKQLALAFLEDRTFRSTLTSDVNQSASAPVRPEPADESARIATSRHGWASKVLQISAACAVLLAAFVSGRYSATAGRDATPDQIVADSKALPDSKDDHQPANDASEVSDELPPPIEFISLHVGGEGEEAQTVDVPLLPWDQVSEASEAEEMNEPPTLIPAEIRELLARRGQTVRESIDYYQFELSDGRVGVIPVSSVEIQANTIPLIQ